jgi:hypothetical protein
MRWLLLLILVLAGCREEPKIEGVGTDTLTYFGGTIQCNGGVFVKEWRTYRCDQGEEFKQ